MKLKVRVFLMLFVAMFTFIICNNNNSNIQTAHALASWTPSGGLQPGISVTIPTVPTPDITIPVVTVPDIEVIDDTQQIFARDYLLVENEQKEKTWDGTAYLGFIDYFKIYRRDGRKIYSIDKWYKESVDIVNYNADLTVVQTGGMPSNNDGFFWTTQRAKFESGAYYLNFYCDGCSDDSWETELADQNGDQSGINPNSAEVLLGEFNTGDTRIPYTNGFFSTVDFYGKAYWHNEFWGNTWNSQTIDLTLTPKIYNNWRSWDNSLSAQNSEVKTATLANGTKAFYYTQPFIVVANNLNNYIKVNGNKVTPNVTEGITAYYDGFHIGITSNGQTTISLENGAEEKYTDYKCVIDTQVPDFNFNYINTNAFDKVLYGSLTQNSDNTYSQAVSNIVFKDRVQFEFGALENESPETAQVYHNGSWKNLSSGTWLDDAGTYVIEITDLVGNSRTISFEIDDTPPSVNYSNIMNPTDYKVTKWYKVSTPEKAYSFTTLEDAISKAVEFEFNTKVSSFELKNINDFIETNIADNGDPNNTDDEVRTGTYWLYKSLSNPNVNLYYFDYNYLCKVMRYYSLEYIQGPFYYIPNTQNDYGDVLESAMYDNVWNKAENPAYIGNNYKFTKANDNESYKSYYCFVGEQKETWTEIIYDKKFGEQVSKHGLYKIKEIDYVGHESYYYIFFDNEAPVILATVTNYGSLVNYTKTISEYEVPSNSELVYYFASFKIDEIIDNDTWYIMNVKTPTGEIYNYTHTDTIPNLEEFGKGEYIITLFDRVNNSFEFKVAILGKAPTVTFNEINTNTQLEVIVNQGEEYNSVTNIKIYKNDILLNNENGYDEFPDKTDDNLIDISVNNFNYIFNKGGLYKVELTDNYGRVLTYEYKFEKDLPTGILLGVKHNGKTNTQVQFIYNGSKYSLAITENEAVFSDYTSSINPENNLTTLTIEPKQDIHNFYQITLYNNEDFENYNKYNFYIDTLAPTINLVGVNNGETTASDVYATWEENEETLTATFILNNGQEQKYRKTQILSHEGCYTLFLSDSLGNTSNVNFTIDRTIDFAVLENDIEKTIEEIRYTNKVISIRNDEELTIKILKDDKEFDYQFGDHITDEGTYLAEITDRYGNSCFFYFTIDTTPPTAILEGVENYGTTSNQVRVVWEDFDNSATAYIDDFEGKKYENGENIILNGKYKIVVSDLAGNSIQFEFTIDNNLEYFINTFSNGISNGDVYVLALEYLTIEVYKDEVKIDYEFEQKLTEHGSYKIVLKDEIGNTELFYFDIVQKPKQKLDLLLNESVKITSVLKEEQPYSNDKITARNLYLFEEGIYLVSVDENEKEYTFEIKIDTTPPTLVLVGVENGGFTKGEVSTRNLSEQNCTIITEFNGKEIEYALGQKLENAGTYKIKVYDEAGNFTEYNFTIIYALNGASIALIAGALAIVVVVIAITIWQRRKYKKAKVEYEVETDLEDDK